MSELMRLIANDNYLVVNRDLIRVLGLECAVFLSELANEAVYWEKAGKLEDGWFYSTQKNIENNIGLKRSSQEKCIKELKALGILEAQVKGMPATRYFRLIEPNISLLFSTNKIAENDKQDCRETANKIVATQQTSLSQDSKQDCCQTATNINKDNINNTNNNKNNINTKHIHGEYQNVRLTDQEMQKLMDKLGDRKTGQCITYLDEYKERKGYKCKSDYLTILKWVVNAVDKEHQTAKAESGSRIAWIDDWGNT